MLQAVLSYFNQSIGRYSEEETRAVKKVHSLDEFLKEG
jgi:hypothetical protein